MPSADVRIAEQMDHLVVSPRPGTSPQDLLRTLKERLAMTSFRRGPEGVWIPANLAPALSQASASLDWRWAPEAERFAANRAWVERSWPSVRAEIKAIIDGGKASAEKRLEDITGLEPMDDHQWVNVAAMTVHDSFGLCVFDEQGAGKTVTLIFAFDVLVQRDEVDIAIIIAPKSMVAEWPQDFARFKGDLYKVAVISGHKKQKLEALTSGADVIVTNFETAVSMEQELKALLRRYGRRAVLVVDESFFIKNLDAQRTRAIRRLREWCGKAYVLCGTPAPNSPHDIVQQLNLVDFGHSFDHAEIPKDRQLAIPVVQEVLESSGLYVRHLKADVLPGLGPKRFHRILVPMQPRQRDLYTRALQGLIEELTATDEVGFRRQLTHFLARRSALLQICSHPSGVTEAYTEVPGKLLALDGILKSIIEEKGEKVVLWSFYHSSIEAIMARYSLYNPVRFDGTVGDVGLRRSMVRQFQEDESTKLFVANPAAAGAGLTLHRARISIYESLSNQAAHYLQSLDRTHRRGQERDVEYMVLLSEGSIEINEYETLLRKEKTAQQLLGDAAFDGVTRESMLSEVLTALAAELHQNGGGPHVSG